MEATGRRAGFRPAAGVFSGAAVLAGVLLVIMTAAPNRAQKAGQGAKTMQEEPLDVARLRFESRECERRFKALRAHFSKTAQAPGWDHVPLRKLGNFLEESWCFPPEPDWNCFSGYARDKRGTLWFEVSTLFYDKDWPGVFGLNASAGNNGRGSDWGVQIAYSVQGKGIVGEGLNLDFVRYDGESAKQHVHLGTSFEYAAEATTIRIPAPGGQDAELALYYASPVSLRDTGLARCDALRAEVEKAFKEHRIQKRVYGPYKGGGIPPMHEDVPLGADEEKAAIEKARRELGETRAAIEQNYQHFYKLLVELIPYDCWK